jgi:hypothetical protein
MTTPAWEKQGNVTWVSCPDCKGWWPVDPQLIERGDIDLACPHCQRRFKPADAAQVEAP